MLSYWKAPSEGAERNRLAPRNQWKNLAGMSPTATTRTRTRHAGNGRPDLNRRMLEDMSLESKSSSESEWYSSSSSDEECEEEEEQLLKEIEKPPASRIILEVDALTKAFEGHAICKSCNGSVSLQVKTTCLASSVYIHCNNSNCGYIFHGDRAAATTLHEMTRDERERSTDYAANVLYVVAFLSMGDGCSEAARLLELLGLPNDTTMESRSFTIIEERIGPVIRNLTTTILQDNLIEEVRLTKMMKSGAQDHHDFLLWKSSLEPGFVGELSIAKYPTITVSYDMAWQQRSSGHNYNSPSGHALMVGAMTRKPVLLCVKSKRCNFCFCYNKKNPEALEVPDHRCWKNHDKSSKAMEANACLDMTVDMFDNKHIIIKGIVLDDDSSTKSMVRWNNKDWMLNNNTNVPPRVLITKGENKGKFHARPNKGLLPRHIPEPSWVHDPNHRKRVMTGDLHKLLAAKAAAKFTMTKMDIIRIGKNYGYMVRSLNLLMPDDEITAAGRAVLEHHFDNHEFCSDRWCRRKVQDDEERLASARYYRSKTKDALLYDALDKLLSRFLTLENLREVAHGLDTQMNESFNNAASWLAPKNKVYCGSGSLTNRISIALGINALGTELYFKRLYTALGITMTPNVMHCLKVKGNQRVLRIGRIRTKEAKKNRIKRKYVQLATEERKAKTAGAKRDGTYRSGMNVEEGAEDGYTLDELLAAAGEPDDSGAATKTRKPRKVVVCPHCFKKGHSTTRSKQCLMNPKNKQAQTAPVVAVVAPASLPEEEEDDGACNGIGFQDMDDADRMDTFPLTDDLPSDVSDIEQFFDAGTWSDEDEDTMPSGTI